MTVTVRNYQPSDCAALAALFYDTIHRVNARDYSPAQLDAWATGQVDLEQWNSSFLEHYTLVATEGAQIVGFGDMDSTGCLDRLYVHADFQRRGVAAAICDELERAVAAPRFTTHASITAKPFFEARGYRALYSQQVTRRGVELTNYVMEKQR